MRTNPNIVNEVCPYCASKHDIEILSNGGFKCMVCGQEFEICFMGGVVPKRLQYKDVKP